MRTFIAALIMITTTLPASAADLDKLAAGQTLHGFRVAAVYLNDSDKPMGARFLHEKSGFTLDFLQIESVPQGYTWVTSIPVSDQGEPHTQEHLLLGKGTRGRSFASLDTMWLTGSTAFTQQWRTSYHYNTAAGPEVFFNLFARQLDAMLHPNYTDEEIRREVRNFGVTQNPDGTLRLEEKGSVYNEMVSSTGNPYRALFRASGHLVYGKNHPLAYNSGGEPSGIRTMKPEDIRNFHKSTHYLANMGTIISFPKSVPLDDVLKRTDKILDEVEPEGKKRQAQTLASLPKPEAAPAGSMAYTEYPHRNDQQPSPMALVWPATRELDANQQVLAQLFFQNVAGDPTTNLYKLFIDSKTRKLDIGARQIFSNVGEEGGYPIFIAFTDVAPSNFNDAKLTEIRKLVTDEIARVAAFPDGSTELKEFNTRIESRLAELERDLAKFVNSPPGFGFRGGNSAWMDQFLLLERTGGGKKSVTLKPQLALVRDLVKSGKNFWREYLAKWNITNTVPYAVAARPSPSLIQREDTERVARANAEAARLMQVYGVSDAQEAIKRYRAEYDAESARIEETAKDIKPPEFVKSPPMTIDDQLQYEVRKLDNGVPMVASRFDAMTSAMTGLALRLDGVPREQLRYVSLLPALLARVGVIENGKPVSFEEMSERLRNEILSLDSFFTTNQRTGRVELVVRGSGIGTEEARRAIQWMTLILHSPDWRAENLPRIRDVVDQSLSQLRNTQQGSEESWVQSPAAAYRMQTNPAYLAADSFLTRAHNALRLKWLLKDAEAADRDALSTFFNELAKTPKKRPEVQLSAAASAIANDAYKDLELTLIEIPDSSLAADWAYLATAMRDDLLTPASETLAALDQVRRSILKSGGARMYMVGSGEMQKAIAPQIAAFAAKLENAPFQRAEYGSTRHIDTRLRQRDPSATKPVHVGLFSPNKPGGVIITSVPSAHFSDFNDREKQLDYLASRLHAGYGAHGIFLKTIGAGLAYSNGLRGSVISGRAGYYAERTPELPQTVKFVINELKTSPRNENLGDYTVAQIFGAAENRAASSYEARAEGIAADLADNQPPEMVRKFRQSILDLRKDPKLGATLWDRKDRVYGRFLPGYNVKVSEVPDAFYFVIGPDKQLDAWDRYLGEVGEAKLHRLYGRDYWMP
jgi:Zn-dependent M16 (insulinase) family peptidase